jgi:methyltransferase (TIGR00027 family)
MRPVRFVPVDFESDDAAAALSRSGFDCGVRSIVVWEGVVSYLTAASVDRNFRLIAGLCAPRSRLVFTYWQAGALEGRLPASEAAPWMAKVARSGEPFVFGFEPDELAAYLGKRGFELITDLSTADIAGLYNGPLARHELGTKLYRVALAERRWPV